MADSRPRKRLEANATEITSLVVTGIWLAALFTGQSWWLAALLVGYTVVVPVVALLYDDDDTPVDTDLSEETPHRAETQTQTEDSRRDALETLRDRYARGELTDEQFERKLEYLLETETLEDIEQQYNSLQAANNREKDGERRRQHDRR